MSPLSSLSLSLSSLSLPPLSPPSSPFFLLSPDSVPLLVSEV